MKKISTLIVLALLATLPGTGKTAETSLDSITPISSPNDTRKYEYFTLKNRMKVLLISDPAADKASASLSVNIGSASDPKRWPGLAHFLEHMLFMGTRKYPDINAYQHYIGENGGDTNAGTSVNITNFSFTIKPDKLEGALDRFSQFFIAPLIKPEYVEHEKHAVDSEYHLKIKDEGRRLHAAIQQAYNPASPYSTFLVGSLKSLSDKADEKVHDALVQFYRTHYSSNLMGLVVLGREKLPRLRTMIQTLFAEVPDHNATPYTPRPNDYMLSSQQLPAALGVRPLGTLRHVSLVYPVPAPRNVWKVMPVKYIATLLADASPGSFYDVVHTKGWVESLSVNGETLDPVQGQIGVEMGLSPEGILHLQEVLRLFYAYVELIRTRGIERWRYEERQHLDALLFRYEMRENPFDYVTHLADRLHFYPAHDLLTANKLLQHYDAAVIRRYLDAIRPDNALNVLDYPEAPTDRIESWYHVPYVYQKLDRNETDLLLHGSTSQLALPGKNPFVPDHLTIYPLEHPDQNIPMRLIDQPGLTLWHHQDAHFHVPRAGIRVLLRSPIASDNARDSVLIQLWNMLASERLSQIGQQALKAGLAFEINVMPEGLVYTLFGYDEKLPLLHRSLLESLGNRTIDSRRFTRIKRQLTLSLQNSRNDLPFKQVIAALNRSYHNHMSDPAQQLAALRPLAAEDLRHYIDRFLERLQVEMLTLGNLIDAQSRKQAYVLQHTLLSNTRLVPVPDPSVRIPQPGTPRMVHYAVSHTDSVTIQADLDPQTSLDAWARWYLVAYLYKGDFYTQLRSREQLGYVVQAAQLSIQNHPGMVAIVESPNTSVSETLRRIAHFNTTYADRLDHIAPALFSQNKQGAVTLLSKGDTTLVEQMDRYFDDILHDRFTFDFRQRLVRRIRALTSKELADFFREHILRHPTRTYGISPGAQGHNGTTEMSGEKPPPA